MKYMIGIDLDGTLLNDEKHISIKTKTYLQTLSTKGHLIVLSTGRSYLGAINYHKELKLSTPIIALNGALIVYPDGRKDIIAFENSTLKTIFNDLKPYLKNFLLNGIDIVYSYNNNKDLEYLFNGANTNNKDINDYDFNDNILNAIIMVTDENRKTVEFYIKENTNLNLRYWGTFNNDAFYDLSIPVISKAHALERVLKHYNHPVDRLITFGDSVNDLEMLSLTKYGVAMKNAHDEIKKQASFVTDFDNNNDGIALFLEKQFEL
ncbi:MAG: HAD family hydrolase [Acholeplasma sp.]|nr:HAD family hydrolase [Acholeplasma sp.]